MHDHVGIDKLSYLGTQVPSGLAGYRYDQVCRPGHVNRSIKTVDRAEHGHWIGLGMECEMAALVSYAR